MGGCIRTLSGHIGWVYFSNYSPDGSQIVSGSGDGTIKIWDTESGQCIKTLIGNTDYIKSCNFSQNESRIVSGSYDGRVKIWDSNSGLCIRTIDVNNLVTSCNYSPDGSQIVYCCDNILKVRNFPTGIPSLSV